MQKITWKQWPFFILMVLGTLQHVPWAVAQTMGPLKRPTYVSAPPADYDTYPPVGPFPTKDALFEAMASEKMNLQNCSSDCPSYEWWSIITVLRTNYGLPDVTPFIGKENVKPPKNLLLEKEFLLNKQRGKAD